MPESNAHRQDEAGASSLPRSLRPFLLALGFLTRLGPGGAATAEEMACSVCYYPLVGALLGIVLTLPLALGLGAGQPFLQAWLYVLLSLWLTRALHLDGLADVLDALGSAKHGADFRAVLKDSRIGVFGAAGAVLAISGHIVCAAALLSREELLPLAAAPLIARCLPIMLACLAAPSAGASLGTLLARAPRKKALAAAALAAPITALVSMTLPSLLACALMLGICLFYLTRLAAREGGYNGDYFGFLITAGELIVLTACAL